MTGETGLILRPLQAWGGDASLLNRRPGEVTPATEACKCSNHAPLKGRTAHVGAMADLRDRVDVMECHFDLREDLP